MIETPEIIVPSELSDAICARSEARDAVEVLEAQILREEDRRESPFASLLPLSFRTAAESAWSRGDHFVVRGAPSREGGAAALILSAALFGSLRRYRMRQIVKVFHLSPWTKSLSHTLEQGEFHTDINTAPEPPVATVIQCLRPDPDAPNSGLLRVARVADLLEAVKGAANEDAWSLLTKETVVMVNDASAASWSGRILDSGTIRFHPTTLRAAQRRFGGDPARLEESLRVVNEAAMSVSRPIDLRSGDMLFSSNRRALHQRGACTVRFRTFPSDFDTRVVAVLHTMTELS